MAANSLFIPDLLLMSAFRREICVAELIRKVFSVKGK
jgi:hypothetical protein